jgi:L-Lysine epsilon oxidase N-terminal/L-lysine epsilon oxidase C-terminal domain/Iron-containing redox enzyme
VSREPESAESPTSPTPDGDGGQEGSPPAAAAEETRIAYCKIFPPIGIARLGNSPDEYFIGPQVSGLMPDPGAGSYKDAQGRVKRQAARFHVYGYNAAGDVVAELTADHPAVGRIAWSVTLANAKADWYRFAGADNVASILNTNTSNVGRRNAEVPAPERGSLIIGPATQVVVGRDQGSDALEGRFRSWPTTVHLGELRTDAAGRLVVLGGRGESGSVRPDNPLAHYANNDDWFDDTSDGPVTVEVTLAGGQTVPVRGHAWVICAPPDYTPHTRSAVSLYDVMLEAALVHDLPWSELDYGVRPGPQDPVSFTRDVYPILQRLVQYQWVSDRARRGHSPGRPGYFLDPDLLAALADPSLAKAADGDEDPNSPQRRVFDRLRTPILHPTGPDARPPSEHELDPASQDAIDQANLSYMPPLSGDEGDVTHPIYDPETNKAASKTWLSLTATQYRLLARWTAGDFIGDWTGSPPAPAASLDAVPLAAQPATLTRASLEACQGGAFFPGIESTSIVRYAAFYSEAFRVSNTYTAGDITRWMALPWQADFYECRDHWWPTARPDDVLPEADYGHILEKFQSTAQASDLTSLLVVRKPWARGLELSIPPRPDLPPPAADATPADYQTFCRRHLLRLVGGYLGVVPSPVVGELDGVYLRRLQEFVGKTIATPDFGLPSPTPGESLPDAYLGRVRTAIQTFLVGQANVPAPAPGEILDDYAARLADYAVNNVALQGVFDVEWRRRYRHRGKNDLVANWSRLGFVVPRTAFGETVYVEGDRGRFDLISPRDSFFYLMNLEGYPDFLPKARELADEYFGRALSVPLAEEYTFFEYDQVTFAARLEKIYENQRRDAVEYNPTTLVGESLFRTPEQVVERIRQLAPFNQLDGGWLEKIAQAGPTNEVQGFLFEIWSDELGNGDPVHNHANVYTDLMHSAGIYLPPMASRAYADHPDLWDSSFESPVYQSAVAQFPERYAPELLGMTLYLEWEAVFLPAMVKLYEYHGHNPLFYKLHVAIDNPVDGHGARAREAVAHYLDHVREESGEAEMQEHWRRIWTGYLAFKFVGGGGWQFYFTNPPTPYDRVRAMLERKRHYAQLNHARRRLGPNFINDWFDEPDAFLDQLIQSDLVTPGDAGASRIFATMEFGGPMLKVFTRDEQHTLEEWINSLPPVPLGIALRPGQAMRVLVTELSARAMGVPDHVTFTLAGSYFDPATGAEVFVDKPVSWWFQIGQPERLMAALADPGNGWIVPGNVADSRFVIELLSAPRRMARFLIQTVPEIGGKTAREVVIDWIAAGCPAPEDQLRTARLNVAVTPRTNVRADAPMPFAERQDPHAGVIQARTLSAVRLTPAQHAGIRRRFYGPGGGACH